jgi:tRNA G26 N,N-dimethylase Trm1
LRRYFLRKYPCSSVLDCCAGYGLIWSQLRSEFQVEYTGMDTRNIPGILKMDSKRYLASGKWSADCVDIDTWGSPWGHLIETVKHMGESCVVFLTNGIAVINGAGHFDKLLIEMFNMPKSTPMGIQVKLKSLSMDMILGTLSRKFGIEIEEACESDRAHHARYVGLKLKRKESNVINL